MLRKLVFVIVIILSCLVLNSCQKTADEHYNNAMEFVKVKNFTSAITELNKAIEINPNYAKAYLDRGNVYLIIQDYKKAQQDFENAQKIDSTNKQINWLLVSCKLEMKDTVGAKLFVDQIVNKNPADAESYYFRAVNRLTRFNDNVGACKDLKQAKELYRSEVKYFRSDLKEEIEKLIEINCKV